MNVVRKKIFSNENYANYISEEDCFQTSSYLNTIKALAKLSSNVICVTDHLKDQIEFVSENPLILCGHSAKEIQAMGGNSFRDKYVADNDYAVLIKADQLGSDFYSSIPLEERLHYSLSYHYHLTNSHGNRFLVNQKCTPLFLNEEGKIWKSICHISLSSKNNAGNYRIYNKENQNHLEYDESKSAWKKTTKINLSDREKEILQLSLRGFCIEDIAKNIFVSPNTVKFHRKKLFEKFEVTNISEAISFARNNHLI